MRIRVNGEERQLSTDKTVDDLLAELGIPAAGGVAVALNQRVVRRADRAATTLTEGDEVEIIRAVAGG